MCFSWYNKDRLTNDSLCNRQTHQTPASKRMVFSVFINFSHSQQNPNTFIIYDKDNETKELKEPEEDNDTEHIQTL